MNKTKKWRRMVRGDKCDEDKGMQFLKEVEIKMDKKGLLQCYCQWISTFANRVRGKTKNANKRLSAVAEDLISAHKIELLSLED